MISIQSMEFFYSTKIKKHCFVFPAQLQIQSKKKHKKKIYKKLQKHMMINNTHCLYLLKFAELRVRGAMKNGKMT